MKNGNALREEKIKRRGDNLVSWLALVFCGLFWGMTGPFSKMAVSTGHHPLGVTFWATFISALLITGFMVIKKRRLPLGRRHLIFYLICGLLGTVLPHGFTYASYQHLSVGLTLILLSLVPMFTFALAIGLKLEKPETRRLIGLLLGLLSIALIVLPSSSLPERDNILWAGILILVALSYASEGIYIALQKPSDCDATATMCGLNWAALLVLTPPVFLNGYGFDITTFGRAEIATLANGALHLTAYFLYVWLLQKAGAVFAAQTSYLITAVGVVAGMVFYNETHSLWVWAALFLMMVGITLVKPKEV